MAGNNIYVQGSYIDIHDNKVVNLSVDKGEVHIDKVREDSSGAADAEVFAPEPRAEVTEEPMTDEELRTSLKPIFYNNEADVEVFLKEIAGMAPNDITDLVNRWVQEKRISDYGYSRKGALWDILYRAGLYSKSRQNWNRRVV